MKRLMVLFALITSALALGQSYPYPGGGDSLPSQTGNSGKFLTTDGSAASWATISGLLSGGTSGRVMIWSGSATATSDSIFNWDTGTHRLAIGAAVDTGLGSKLQVTGDASFLGGSGVNAWAFQMLNSGTDSPQGVISSHVTNKYMTFSSAVTDGASRPAFQFFSSSSLSTADLLWVDNGNGTHKVIISKDGNMSVGHASAPSFGMDVRTNLVSSEGDIKGTTATYNGTTSYSSSPEAGYFAGGFYNSSNGYATFGGITWTKENNTDGNVASYSEWATRPAGGNPTTYLRMTSTGLLAAYGTSPSFWLDARPNVAGAVGTDGSATALMGLYNNYTAYNSTSPKPTSGIIFGAQYHSNGSLASGGAITVYKTNTTSNNVAFEMGLHARPAGGSVTEYVHITSAGNVGLEATSAKLCLDGYATCGNWVSKISGDRVNLQSTFGFKMFGGGAFNENPLEVRDMPLQIGSSGANYWDIRGSTTTNPLLATATGSDSNISINIIPKGTGALKNNSDPVPAVHASQSTAQQSIEFGAATLDGATPAAVTVTFATAFSAAPKCQCTTIDSTGAENCTLNAAPGTSSVTFNGGAASTKVIDWFCIGAR